tara:strand:- start:23226 stop:23789 length:564 start_codon:yes stop_codon:yes gene_type:complete
LSQLTLVALVILIAILWKFAPWSRAQRILSYDFPEGWWRHVALIDPSHESWSNRRKKHFEDYARLFVDRVEFVLSPSMQEDFEIKHRIAFATQAFLLFENISPDPLRNIEKIYIVSSFSDAQESYGLLCLSWSEIDLNYERLIDATELSMRVRTDDKKYLAAFVNHQLVDLPEIKARLEQVLGTKVS